MTEKFITAVHSQQSLKFVTNKNIIFSLAPENIIEAADQNCIDHRQIYLNVPLSCKSD